MSLLSLATAIDEVSDAHGINASDVLDLLEAGVPFDVLTALIAIGDSALSLSDLSRGYCVGGLDDTCGLDDASFSGLFDDAPGMDMSMGDFDTAP